MHTQTDSKTPVKAPRTPACFLLFGRFGPWCVVCGAKWRYGDVFLNTCPRSRERDGGRS